MCSCNEVTRAPYGAVIYRGLSAMLPSYRGWRLVWVGVLTPWEWRLDSWVEDHSMSLRSSSMLLTLPSM